MSIEKSLELFEKFINNTSKKDIIELFDKVESKKIEGVSLEEYFNSFEAELESICLPPTEYSFLQEEYSVDLKCHWYSNDHKIEVKPIAIKENLDLDFSYLINNPESKVLYNAISNEFLLAA